MTDLQNPMVAYAGAGAAEGNETRLRSERTRGLVVQQAHAAYAEECIRGNTWTISTATAGITVTALMLVSVASAIPIVGLYNPSSSSKNLVIHRGMAIQTTGTVCNFVWGAVAAPSMTIADGVTTGKNNFTLASGGHEARAFAGATAMVGIALPFRFGWGATVEGATVAGTVLAGGTDWVDGEIVVKPANFVGIFGVTITTAGVVKASIVWSEVPV